MTEMNPYERAILARLEAKAKDAYLWPRWPAAYEAGQAALEVADQETAELRAKVEQETRHCEALSARVEREVRRREAAEAESARLASEQRELAAQVAGLRSVVAKVEQVHVAYTLYEPCANEVTGCDAPACTENPHDGEWFHADEPVGKACAECNDDEGLPIEWPCATIRALASVGVSGSADDRREANASQAPDTATPGEACSTCGQSMDSPPCIRSADGSISGHTTGGGADKCEATR